MGAKNLRIKIFSLLICLSSAFCHLGAAQQTSVSWQAIRLPSFASNNFDLSLSYDRKMEQEVYADFKRYITTYLQEADWSEDEMLRGVFELKKDLSVRYKENLPSKLTIDSLPCYIQPYGVTWTIDFANDSVFCSLESYPFLQGYRDLKLIVSGELKEEEVTACFLSEIDQWVKQAIDAEIEESTLEELANAMQVRWGIFQKPYLELFGKQHIDQKETQKITMVWGAQENVFRNFS